LFAFETRDPHGNDMQRVKSVHNQSQWRINVTKQSGRQKEKERARKKRDTKVQNKCCGTIDNSRAPLQNDQAE